MAVLWIWGEHVGIKTIEARFLWLSVVAGCALLLCLIVSLDRWSRWSQALFTLKKWLHIGRQNRASVPQAGSFNGGSSVVALNPLNILRQQLNITHGFFWRYRQPWLLLTGRDATIMRLLPEIVETGWLITPDAVLLWHKTDENGQPNAAWLKQLYKMRRRRPIDAVVLVMDSTTELSAQRHRNIENLNLAHISEALCWSAPVHVLDVEDALTAGKISDTPVIGAEFATTDVARIEAALLSVRDQLIPLCIKQLSDNSYNRFTAKLSQRLDTHSKPLAAWIDILNNSRRRQRVAGAFFAPYPSPAVAGEVPVGSADLPLWSHLSKIARNVPGRRVGWHPETVLSVIALTGLGIWIAGMLVSAAVNQRDIAGLQQTSKRAEHAPGIADRVRGLLALQQEIARYEYRTEHHAPLLTRFGLNRDKEILQALWAPYRDASQHMLVAPVQQTLETELIDLAQLRSDQLDKQAGSFALDGHQALKSYLMLAEPQRSDTAFLTPQLIRRWQLDTQLAAGEQRDLAERLLTFYSKHLAAHPDWKITPSAGLVQAARQTLLAAIGVEHADSTLYRNIVTNAADKYPDQTLASLTVGTDPRGLIRNNAIVSGVFTRQAYEGTIAPAIAEAAKRNTIASDWVLTGQAQQTAGQSAQSPETLQAALTAQYFAEYAEQWQLFMNNVQWDAAPTMPAAIEQLKLMADARQSPVIALMKSLQYQGTAGVRQASLSDTLVAKAQNLLTSTKVTAPQAQHSDPAGSLGSTFGPVLRLIGSLDGNAGAGSANPNEQANSDMSLQRYLDRISALRLRLQQINSSPDAEAQAKQLALSLFQGKGSELADTQAYAQLVAASLGEQWASMGDALFIRPVVQATQTVLQPAQAGLNEAWNNGIVATWYKAFNGRYPFAQTDNDASLPELARFLRPQSGLIASFLQSQLAGVLELQGDQWVPNAGSKLNFDPAFLTAVNTLQRIGARLLVQGEPQYRFDLKPMPTPGVEDTILTIDTQKLHYYNQRETWQNLVWPVNQTQDAGTRLQWQTEKAGTNKQYEFTGRWALVRLLERARIEPIDSATYQLTWQATPDVSAPASSTISKLDPDNLMPRAPMAPASAELVYPLSYVMRTEAGRGPLEMLSLRDFALPSRIFVSASRNTVTRK